MRTGHFRQSGKRAVVTSLLVAAVLLATAAPQSASALPKPLPQGLSLDDSLDSSRKECEKGDSSWTVRELSADKPQELAEGLLRTGLLAMLNRAGARHSLTEEPGDRNVKFIRIAGERTSAVLAFAKGRMEAAMVRHSVAVDGQVSGDRNPFDPERLAPVHDFIDSMRRSCSLKPVDKGKNHFVFSGRCGGAQAYLEYLPEEDSFLILYHR